MFPAEPKEIQPPLCLDLFFMQQDIVRNFQFRKIPTRVQQRSELTRLSFLQKYFLLRDFTVY